MGRERHSVGRVYGGFTLVEMLAAILILCFGVTAVFGVFSTGVATEQTAELVRDASRLVSLVKDRLVHEGQLGRSGEALPAPVIGARQPGFPGLVYDVVFEASPGRPEEIVVHVGVRWLRQGTDVTETYSFVLPRTLPLHARVRERNEQK